MILQIIGWVLVIIGILMILGLVLVLVVAYSTYEALKDERTTELFDRDDDA